MKRPILTYAKQSISQRLIGDVRCNLHLANWLCTRSGCTSSDCDWLSKRQKIRSSICLTSSTRTLWPTTHRGKHSFGILLRFVEQMRQQQISDQTDRQNAKKCLAFESKRELLELTIEIHCKNRQKTQFTCEFLRLLSLADASGSGGTKFASVRELASHNLYGSPLNCVWNRKISKIKLFDSKLIKHGKSK